MKKFVSILLALTFVFSACGTAFANADNCDCGNTPVIFVRGFGETIYENPESENRVDIFSTVGDTAKAHIPQIMLAALGLFTFNYNLFGKYAIEVADSMLEKLECDENGVPLYNTGVMAQEAPVYETHLKEIPLFNCDELDEKYEDSCYYFTYDWRMSPLDNAKLLDEYVADVKEVTRHDKVSIVCHSQGNTVVASYLYLYGSENVEKIAFLSPAYQGVSLISSIMTKEVDVGGKADALELFMGAMTGEEVAGVSTFISILNKIKLLDPVLSLLDAMLDSQYDRVYDEYISEAFGNLAGVWAFVTVEDYENARLCKFGENPEETEFLKKIDEYHYNVQKKIVDILADTMLSGTEVIICAGYDISTIPVTTAPAGHSDMLIDSELMTLGATFAPIGETFEEGYVQKVHLNHDHISGDMMVDASTCTYPEITWFFKGMEHNTFPEGYVLFINKFLTTEDQITVHTFEEYPQFLKPVGDEIVAI